LKLFSIGRIQVTLAPNTSKALTGAGKAFFSTLAATYLTGNASLMAAIWAAFILAGLNFFSTETAVIPAANSPPSVDKLPDEKQA
jgi:hypothetical protein